MVKHYYINGRFLTQTLTGVQRYAIELLKALDNLISSRRQDFKNVSFTVLAPKNTIHKIDLECIPIRQIGLLTGQAWEQFVLPLYSRDGTLVSLCNIGPLCKRNQVVTIHDAAVFGIPESFSFAFRLWYRLAQYALGKIVKHILTVSNFSKNDIVRHMNISSSKITVIYHGREHIYSTTPQDNIIIEHGLKDRPYLLAVSSLSPRKNFQAIILALEKLNKIDFDIVIVGGRNQKVFGTQSRSLAGSVIYLDHVSDDQLRALYEHAACFIYPSLYEGFGLPPLEAITCGCPVIASDIPPLREVCGEAALYCDPYDIDDIADKINTMLTDKDLRRQFIKNGLKRAEMFSWQKTAISFVRVLLEA